MATNNPRKKKATPEPATLTWASARQQNKNPSGTALASTTAATAAPLLSLLPLPPLLHTVATKVVSVYHYHRRRHCCHPLSSPLSPPLPLQTIQPMVLGNRRRRPPPSLVPTKLLGRSKSTLQTPPRSKSIPQKPPMSPPHPPSCRQCWRVTRTTTTTKIMRMHMK